MAMQLNLLKAGAIVTARMHITPEKARHWKHAATNASLGGGLAAGARLTVAATRMHPPEARLELPGRSPPAYIVLTGEELAMNFDMVVQPKPAASGGQDMAAAWRKITNQQLAVGAGLDAMREARVQLQKDIASGQFWGGVAIFTNAVLIPLNVVVNAFEVGAAASLYQALAKEAYSQFSKSGTRIDNSKVKTGLKVLKKALVDTLASKGLKHYIPGVNILVGLGEDSFALFETASTVKEGSQEMRQILRQVDAKIAEANGQFLKLGIELDRLLTELQRRARTA